ncbi:MAG: ATP synthase F1 subunit delta [Bryobacteraceae bacterium]
MSLAVATRYAQALVAIAVDPKNQLDATLVVGNLKDFEAAIASSPDLHKVLESPAVANVRKRAVVAKLAVPLELQPLVVKFLYVVIDHRRVPLLGEIRRSFETLLDERLGVVRADVASALPLDDSQRVTLAAELTHLTGKQVRCEFSVDGDLVGGVSARIGSTIYDGSVRGRLAALRRQLAAEA